MVSVAVSIHTAKSMTKLLLPSTSPNSEENTCSLANALAIYYGIILENTHK